MTSLPRALALSLGQLGDPAIVRVLGKTAAMTLGIFVVLGMALYYGLAGVHARYVGGSDAGLVALLATLLAILVAWLLFRIVALFVLQFFIEDVVRAVEKRHYPAAAASSRDLSLGVELRNAARALARTLAFNALALPVAGALLVTGIGPAIVFWAVNALLLGRELQDMVWLRYRADALEAAPIGGVTRFLLGGIVVALLAIPFLNFLAPILGAASATHLVHGTREEGQHA